MRDEVQKTSTPAPDASDPPHGARPRRLGLIVLAALLVLAGLVAYGAFNHAQRREAALDTEKQQEDSVPVVRIATVGVNSAPRVLDLPGSTEAFDAATVYARATGYIAKRNVDIGSEVKVGDVLAVIAAPDLDQQLLQAEAQVAQLQAAIAQAQSNSQLANVTNQRTQTLVVQGWQTKQQGDTDRLTYQGQAAAVQVAQANLKAGEAQVSRLKELTGFEKVVAPFGGFITQRHVDVGSLVTADQSTGTALFDIAHSEVLRTQIYVPQDAVFSLKDGASAEIRVPEIPGRVFHGTVARNANALTPGTRTRLTEVDVDNSDGTLFPGLYCTVRLFIPRAQPVISIPAQALIFNKNGLTAAVYDDGIVRIRQLNLLADNGAEVDVLTGLKPEDKIILNPPINIRDGMHVTAAGSSGNVNVGQR
ncbi:efflux RND transporter periplasmic adaptor subunit [Methylovirgula ligni]|uniref:RND family efflux transporter MFP subunit n=1 Tax=Methylovirgula ligni TaxID=569860 RepID=A0A3D9YWU8_9HYPH|nr:efflux RND transporter periplasmic adaptor subunit [Methylovirgula ligni]QAY96250.1 efflux RND transporter periplasmic adaptor subunit [Methylovirgula ligni]REF86043.1 RND family efflux transporter MFP subunit [Methylovirgula ligni]